jgi:hypothetical protein
LFCRFVYRKKKDRNIQQYSSMTLNQPFPSYPNLTQGTLNLPLVAQGSGALPAYQTLQVAGGGTGNVSNATTNAVIATGTTSTGALQTISNGSASQVMTSNIGMNQGSSQTHLDFVLSICL